jgi:hypothetical protein
MLPYFSSRNKTTNGEQLNILDFPNRAKPTCDFFNIKHDEDFHLNVNCNSHWRNKKSHK